MKRVMLLSIILLLPIALIAQTQAGGVQAGAGKAAARPNIFDPARDAAADLQAGIDEAARTGKRVLVDVGGRCVSSQDLGVLAPGRHSTRLTGEQLSPGVYWVRLSQGVHVVQARAVKIR